MSAFRPEAETEYSRGPGPSRGRKSALGGASRLVAVGVLTSGLIGALLLIVAEFTPLLEVHSSLRRAPVASLNTGSHDSYALIPIGLLVALFALVVWRTRSRLALLATGVLGLVALLIALIGDLPDAQATGLVGATAGNLAIATSRPAIGFYLETLGAVVLLLTAVAGLLWLAPPEPRQSRPLRPAASARD
jgi:hypothetical protein